jgi:hypothetical protein
MPKVTLDIVDEYPYAIYGICSSENDYRLCWGLNRELGIALRMEKHLEVFSKKGEVSVHSLYSFTSDYEQVKYRLVQNKTINGFVLREIAKADYLLIVDQSPEIDPEEFIRKIRKSRQVLMAFPVEIENLKSKQNILLTA